jgi:hypothetical protein
LGSTIGRSFGILFYIWNDAHDLNIPLTRMYVHTGAGVSPESDPLKIRRCSQGGSSYTRGVLLTSGKSANVFSSWGAQVCEAHDSGYRDTYTDAPERGFSHAEYRGLCYTTFLFHILATRSGLISSFDGDWHGAWCPGAFPSIHVHTIMSSTY